MFGVCIKRVPHIRVGDGMTADEFISPRIRYNSGVSEGKIGLAITHLVVSFCSRLMGEIRSLGLFTMVSYQFIVTETYERVNTVDSYNFLARACVSIRYFIVQILKINYQS